MSEEACFYVLRVETQEEEGPGQTLRGAYTVLEVEGQLYRRGIEKEAPWFRCRWSGTDRRKAHQVLRCTIGRKVDGY